MTSIPETDLINRTDVGEIIGQLHNFMEQEAKNLKLNNTLPKFQNVMERTSKATGLSNVEIYQVMKMYKKPGEAGSSQETQDIANEALIHEFEINTNNSIYQMIRDTIMEMYLNDSKELPSFDRVLMRLRNFTKVRLNMFLNKLKFKQYKNIIVERNSERLKKIKCIKEMRKLRGECVYAYVGLLNLPPHSNEAGGEVKVNDCYLVAYAASKSGLIKNTLLLHNFKEKTDNILCSFYQKWLKDKIMPNIPVNSVLVIDEGIYNKIFYNSPKWYSSKEEMMEWLSVNKIRHDNLLKPELYDIIKNHKANYFEHGYGVRVMKIQENHPRLNAIGSIWPKIKQHVETKLPAIVSAKDLWLYISGFITNLNATEWQKAFIETVAYEMKIIENENIVAIRLEKLQTKLACYSDSDESTDTDGGLSD